MHTEHAFNNIFTPFINMPVNLLGLGHFDCDANYITKRINYNCYLMLCTISGEGVLEYREKEYKLSKNTIFFIDCSEYQMYKTASSGNWNFKFIHLSGESVKKYFDILFCDDFFLIENDETINFENIWEDIKDTLKLSDVATCAIYAKILTDLLTAMIVRQYTYSKTKQQSEIQSAINNITTYIRENLKEELPIEKLAGICHLSKFYFIKQFTKHVGSSPHLYIIHCRINYAKRLLMETEMTVNHIAEEVGFKNVNNFIRNFKSITNMTPAMFRNWA